MSAQRVGTCLKRMTHDCIQFGVTAWWPNVVNKHMFASQSLVACLFAMFKDAVYTYIYIYTDPGLGR